MVTQPTLNEILSSRIAVVGAGVTGKSVIRYLISRNIAFTAFDEKVDVIANAGVSILTSIPEKQEWDWAIVSPGWKRTHPFIEELTARGVRCISEIDFAWVMRCALSPEQRWVALTGTNGKTTTVQMVESIFNAAGVHGRACGNVGNSVVETLSEDSSWDILALELSSFQIEWSNFARFDSVAILNIAEDHIDWHGSFDGYANAKLKLLTQSDVAILNGIDPEVVARSAGWNGKKIFFSFDTPAPGDIGLVENILVDRAFISDPSKAELLAELTDIVPTVPHNVLNAMAAAGLALSVGISHGDVRRGIQSFRLDSHRLEIVCEIDGVTWVNDSKATNPHAARAALTSFEKVIWIAGGLAKGASMDSLVAAMAPRIRAALVIGQDRELIVRALTEHAPHIPIFRIDGGSGEDVMKSVVEKARELAEAGDTVLLAPACASMDQFRSYAHRGDAFREAVNSL